MIESSTLPTKSDIPRHWDIVKLGDVLNIQTGSKNAQDSEANGEYMFFTRSVTTQRINTYSFDTEALFIAGEGVFKVKHYKGKFDLHQRTYMLTEKASNTICLFFFKDLIQSKIEKLVSASVGSTVQSLRKPIIYDLLLPFPPLYEQQQIGNILSTVDRKIEAITSKIIESEKLKHGLMQQILKKGIGQINFKDSELGRIPESWGIKKINEISNVVRGSSPRPAGDPKLFNGNFLPWITVAEITNNRSKYLTRTKTHLTKLGSLQTRILQPGTVLLSNSGATLGVPTILKIEAGANDGVAAFLKLKEVSELFLFYYLQSLTDYFRNQLAPGSGQPNLNTSLIGNVSIPIPSNEEQEKITSILFSIDEKIDILKEKNQAYSDLKSGLMQQLLTGKIRVNIHQQQSAVA